MKKILCFMLAAILLLGIGCAQAEVPSLSENLFKYAKGTLVCLSSGAYDKIVTSVPFSDVSPSADEWAAFARGSFDGTNPQTKYAVAYWTGNFWKVAVPVSEPSSGDVDALVLVSADGSTITGYSCNNWKTISQEYQNSEYVRWNEEYDSSTSVIIEFDE